MYIGDHEGVGIAVISFVRLVSEVSLVYTRVGTLIVATIYLQLIQNRYMSRSFSVLQCSHQHCVQPVASDVEVHLAAPVVLIVRMEQSTA